MRTVLVVEDKPVTRKMFRVILQRARWSVLDPRLASIPVIVVGARTPATSEARALELGVRRLFQKPAHNDTLMAAIVDPEVPR